ncbi:unnamed protein product [Microthlaspi erraticum]|uniref:Uncharacterized protein n=1 Tax=Microthlaspi erraticum TaxID=1685480 RepID=A0A6D2HTW4_9BRAS|nr:unnamed protein product [Microthlaspi erraticum]
MSNGQGGYNKGYYNYKSNPAMSYRNTDVANPQDQVYPQQQQARSSQAPQHGYGQKNNYQGPQGTFPGQADGVVDTSKKLAEINSKIENLNTRVYSLENHASSVAAATKQGQLPGKAIQNPKEQCKVIFTQEVLMKKRIKREPRADRLVQAPCVLDEESLQALFDEPLGRALKEGEDVASKARPGDKRKDPPAQAPSFKPSQLTMTLFPTKFENGKIEYKIRYKGRSRPFSRAKALVTSEQSRDPTKLKELLSQVLTITLDGGTSSTNA